MRSRWSPPAFEVGSKSADSPTGADITAMVIGAYAGAFIIALLTEKRVRDTSFRPRSWVSYFVFRLILLSPHVFVLSVTPQFLPDSLNFQAIVILIPAILVLAFGVSESGGVYDSPLDSAGAASPNTTLLRCGYCALRLAFRRQAIVN